MAKNILSKDTYILPDNIDRCFDCYIGERIHTVVTITKIWSDEGMTSTRYHALTRDRCLFEWETSARVSDIRVRIGDSVNVRATVKGYNDPNAYPRITYLKNTKLQY